LGAMGRDNLGRFAKGVSGNPRGRPRGSLNAVTLMMRARLEEHAGEIVDALIREAVAGRAFALKMCMDRLMPLGERVEAELPRVEEARDAMDASATVIEMTAEGALTVKEAGGMLGLMDVQRKAIETEKLAAQLDGLERRFNDRESQRGKNGQGNSDG
jgi:hypothetical protein